jgi:hypothetical protein
MDFSINTHKTIFFSSKFRKFWDVTDYHPEKESRPRDSERLERKMGLGYLCFRIMGGYHP